MGLRTGGRRAKSLKNRVKSSKIELRFREIRSQSRSSCFPVLKEITSYLTEQIQKPRFFGAFLLLTGALFFDIILMQGYALTKQILQKKRRRKNGILDLYVVCRFNNSAFNGWIRCIFSKKCSERNQSVFRIPDKKVNEKSGNLAVCQ